jgi:hypothetical protein
MNKESKFLISLINFYYHNKLSKIQAIILSEFMVLGSDCFFVSKENKFYIAKKHKLNYDTVSNVVSMFTRTKIVKRRKKENNKTLYELCDESFKCSVLKKEINERLDDKI